MSKKIFFGVVVSVLAVVVLTMPVTEKAKGYLHLKTQVEKVTDKAKVADELDKILLDYSKAKYDVFSDSMLKMTYEKDNYLVTRISNLDSALIASKASTMYIYGKYFDPDEVSKKFFHKDTAEKVKLTALCFGGDNGVICTPAYKIVN